MSKFLTIKNLLILTIGMVFILTIISFSQALHPRLPMAVSSIPTSNSKGNSTILPITMKFDVPVSASDFTITSMPEENWNTAQHDSQTLTFNHSQYLKSNTSYTLSLIYKSKPLTSLTFTTAGGEADPRYYQQIQSDLNTKYPLAKYTPYDTPSYHVVYSAPLTLEITIKSAGISRDQAIADIRAWVASVGGDVAGHQYVIASPAPTH